MKRRWCNECQAMATVEDEFAEDTGDSQVMVVCSWVMHLSCGHTIEYATGTYRSPLQQAGVSRAYSMPDPFQEER